MCFLYSGIHPDAPSESPEPAKEYTKIYTSQGILKAEGWLQGTLKQGYWKEYHPNGVIASAGHYLQNKKDGYWHYYNNTSQKIKEGHYKKGSAENWWIFYDIANHKMKKIQYRNNLKNGFALCYTHNKLKRAEKYENNLKVDEWTSIIAFKLDNPTLSLK